MTAVILAKQDNKLMDAFSEVDQICFKMYCYTLKSVFRQ